LNMIPDQGTETVRTEEAIYATMAILSFTSDELEGKPGASPRSSCADEVRTHARTR